MSAEEPEPPFDRDLAIDALWYLGRLHHDVRAIRGMLEDDDGEEEDPEADG
jgi:hypothetical protein